MASRTVRPFSRRSFTTGELDVVRIGVMASARIEHGVGTAHGVCAGPLASRGLGNAKLCGEGAVTDPLLEDLDGALPNLGAHACES